jgi:hypothetical protein
MFDQSILARYCLPSLRSYQDDKFRDRYSELRTVSICDIWDSPWILVILDDLEEEQLCDGDEKTLDDLDREYRMERLERLFKWYIRFLEKLFRALMFICVFSVFPNERRPPCKTMPWDILPSLAVLWGVCWMFYTPTNGTQVLEDNETDVTNAFLNFPHGMSTKQLSLPLLAMHLTNFSTASLVESPGHQFPFSTYDSDQNWDWSNDDFGYIADRLHPWATPAEVSLPTNAFEPISSFNIDTVPGVFTMQSTDSDGGRILAGRVIASTRPRNDFSKET